MIMDHFKLLNEDINYLRQDANARIRHLEAALAFACDLDEKRILKTLDAVIIEDWCGGYSPVKKELEKYTGRLTYEDK